jgi:hypothetical protein
MNLENFFKCCTIFVCCQNQSILTKLFSLKEKEEVSKIQKLIMSRAIILQFFERIVKLISTICLSVATFSVTMGTVVKSDFWNIFSVVLNAFSILLTSTLLSLEGIFSQKLASEKNHLKLLFSENKKKIKDEGLDTKIQFIQKRKKSASSSNLYQSIDTVQDTQITIDQLKTIEHLFHLEKKKPVKIIQVIVLFLKNLVVLFTIAATSLSSIQLLNINPDTSLGIGISVIIVNAINTALNSLISLYTKTSGELYMDNESEKNELIELINLNPSSEENMEIISN